MNYSVAIRKIIADYFPYILRNPKFLALVEALILPMQSFVYKNLTYIESTRYKLKITGQTIVLQNFLNDRMDFLLRRIKITHPIIAENYIWKKTEGQSPDFVPFKNEPYNTLFLRGKTENETNTFDFIVEIPADISLQIPKIKSFVEAYKLAGKTYKIEII
jgi:hypothetical protein